MSSGRKLSNSVDSSDERLDALTVSRSSAGVERIRLKAEYFVNMMRPRSRLGMPEFRGRTMMPF
ncbi:hypothetical protein [Paraburkholderia acidipaludis]|uniref:hypothetical protein n=1 Tax=Paraburkholderia acidipaludis TaxID=660537 RepID=UPI001FE14300|nr:hypothetical protein [Paraburkholderia acidipaludis]